MPFNSLYYYTVPAVGHGNRHSLQWFVYLPDMNSSNWPWYSPFRVYDFLSYKVDIEPAIRREKCLALRFHFPCWALKSEMEQIMHLSPFPSCIWVFASRIEASFLKPCVLLHKYRETFYKESQIPPRKGGGEGRIFS